jgi:hypothetical protein
MQDINLNFELLEKLRILKRQGQDAARVRGLERGRGVS